jgi:hypothetical protein
VHCWLMICLWFDKGTLLLKGEVGTSYGKWDPRVGCYRIKAMHYRVYTHIAEKLYANRLTKIRIWIWKRVKKTRNVQVSQRKTKTKEVN